MPHYGHFLTETLSTFWIFQTQPAAAFDRIAFHPCFFGRLAGHARHCLAAFGIPPEAVVLLDAQGTGGPVRFEEVVVPERLFRLWELADPLLARVFDRIREATLAGRDPVPPRDVYLSRRRSYWRGGQRVVANEGLVEEAFRRRGFLIVNPETVAFPDQVALYAAATTLAGLSGSALLNCLFQRPGARLLELEHPEVYDDDLPVSTQVLCNTVAGVAGTFVPFTGRRRHGGTVLHLDLAGVAAALPAVTAPPSPPAARLAAASRGRRPRPAAAGPGRRGPGRPGGAAGDASRDGAAEKSRGPRPPGGAPDGGAADGAHRRLTACAPGPLLAGRGSPRLRVREPPMSEPATHPETPAETAAGTSVRSRRCSSPATTTRTISRRRSTAPSRRPGPPLEIILSDDASADRTFAIMQEKAAAYYGPHRLMLNRNPTNLASCRTSRR